MSSSTTVPPVSGTSTWSQPTPVYATVPNVKEPQDVKCEVEYRKTFSKSMLDKKIEEYRYGKYTKHYIEIYLDFVHLEGVITNLEYLEFKNKLSVAE